MEQTRSQVSLRAATPTDAGDLYRLQGAIYREARWFIGDTPPSPESLVRRLRSLDTKMSLYLVAVCDEELCGWLELHRLHPSKVRHVAILTLAVGRAWRRRGVARGLLERSYHWAARVGVAKISLNVRAENRAAVALYQDQGFVLEGCERKQIRLEDRFEDNLIMAKFLGSGDAEVGS
jgi:ribosomal protein S18 acetylase RimI-like enzyme